MGILDKFIQKASSVTIDGLEKMGISVNYKPHMEALQDDDPDTESKDLIDIYKEVSNKWNNRSKITVPESMTQQFIDRSKQFAYHNEDIVQMVKTWCDDRLSVIEQADIMDDIESEFIQLMVRARVAAKPGSSWTKTLQDISIHQQRTCVNLLYQVSRQVHADNFNTWSEMMNDRLTPFELSIQKVNDDYITLFSIGFNN